MIIKFTTLKTGTFTIKHIANSVKLAISEARLTVDSYNQLEASGDKIIEFCIYRKSKIIYEEVIISSVSKEDRLALYEAMLQMMREQKTISIYTAFLYNAGQFPHKKHTEIKNYTELYKLKPLSKNKENDWYSKNSHLKVQRLKQIINELK